MNPAIVITASPSSHRHPYYYYYPRSDNYYYCCCCCFVVASFFLSLPLSRVFSLFLIGFLCLLFLLCFLPIMSPNLLSPFS